MDCRKHAGPLPGAHRSRGPALRPDGQVLGSASPARVGRGGWRAVALARAAFLCPASCPVAARFRGLGWWARWRDWVVCVLQELGLDPIVANLDLDRVNPHLRQLAKATQGSPLICDPHACGASQRAGSGSGSAPMRAPTSAPLTLARVGRAASAFAGGRFCAPGRGRNWVKLALQQRVGQRRCVDMWMLQVVTSDGWC